MRLQRRHPDRRTRDRRTRDRRTRATAAQAAIARGGYSVRRAAVSGGRHLAVGVTRVTEEIVDVARRERGGEDTAVWGAVAAAGQLEALIEVVDFGLEEQEIGRQQHHQLAFRDGRAGDDVTADRVIVAPTDLSRDGAAVR